MKWISSYPRYGKYCVLRNILNKHSRIYFYTKQLYANLSNEMIVFIALKNLNFISPLSHRSFKRQSTSSSSAFPQARIECTIDLSPSTKKTNSHARARASPLWSTPTQLPSQRTRNEISPPSLSLQMISWGRSGRESRAAGQPRKCPEVDWLEGTRLSLHLSLLRRRGRCCCKREPSERACESRKFSGRASERERTGTSSRRVYRACGLFEGGGWGPAAGAERRAGVAVVRGATVYNSCRARVRPRANRLASPPPQPPNHHPPTPQLPQSCLNLTWARARPDD